MRPAVFIVATLGLFAAPGHSVVTSQSQGSQEFDELKQRYVKWLSKQQKPSSTLAQDLNDLDLVIDFLDEPALNKNNMPKTKGDLFKAYRFDGKLNLDKNTRDIIRMHLKEMRTTFAGIPMLNLEYPKGIGREDEYIAFLGQPLTLEQFVQKVLYIFSDASVYLTATQTAIVAETKKIEEVSDEIAENERKGVETHIPVNIVASLQSISQSWHSKSTMIDYYKGILEHFLSAFSFTSSGVEDMMSEDLDEGMMMIDNQ